MFEDRRSEIMNSVQETLRITSNWIASLHLGDELNLPEMVVMTMKNMALVCEGDVPDSCREIYSAVARFAEELRQYIIRAEGKVGPGGAPVGSFWGALNNLQEMTMKSEVVYITPLESVQDLSKQGVSDDQIACHIYGHRGQSGPFLNPNGTVNKRLLDQAKKGIAEQDAILKDCGWPEMEGVFFPPWTKTANMSRQQELARRIEMFKKLEDGPKQYEDPSSVEEMLLDGCYIQQILSAKPGISRQDILAVAKGLGVEAVDNPRLGDADKRRDLAAIKKLQSETTPTDAPKATAKTSAKSSKSASATSATPADPISPPNGLPPMPKFDMEPTGADDMTREAVIACARANPKFGPSEISEDLLADGFTVSNREITEILNTLKKSQSSP